MPRLGQYLILSFLTCLCVTSEYQNAYAGAGQPLAVRLWEGGAITIESQWGLSLRVHPSPQPAAQRAGSTQNDSVSNPDRIAILKEVDKNVTADAELDHVLIRLPNKTESSWMTSTEWSQSTSSASESVAKLLSVFHVNTLANGPEGRSLLQVRVDGVTMLFVPAQVPQAQATLPDNVDLLVVSMMEHEPLPPEMVDAWRKRLSPQFVLLNVVDGAQIVRDSAAPIDSPEAETAQSIADTISEELNLPVSHITHNAMAVSTTATAEATKLITLAHEPWEMPEELDDLFDAMESSSNESQAVFEKLTVEQLNFRPKNGTHTPRWNTEHMMGRQLLFFSQIYHQVDSSIPVMDLNPKQMPDDYEFAHPTWTGMEESRQTRRVSEFTRRFAYLLDGMEVDEQAPGSRWPSLAALLKQMDRHYREHTTNTEKKFTLPEWPSGSSAEH